MKEKIKNRMFQLAVDCGKMCTQIPVSREFNAYCNQIIRSSSSIGANYRAACRAKSDKDFIYKLKVVEEEADETMYWLDLLKAFSQEHHVEIERLKNETNELLSITVASINTVRRRLNVKED